MWGADEDKVRIYGKSNCLETGRAVRFFTGDGFPHVFRNLRRGIAVNDLRVAVDCLTVQKVFDSEGERAQQRQLLGIPEWMLESVMLEDPLLCKAPVVVFRGQATIGYCPEVWRRWVTALPASQENETPRREAATSRLK
jgi:arsenate reductase-like glutaredoxin family protein